MFCEGFARDFNALVSYLVYFALFALFLYLLFPIYLPRKTVFYRSRLLRFGIGGVASNIAVIVYFFSLFKLVSYLLLLILDGRVMRCADQYIRRQNIVGAGVLT